MTWAAMETLLPVLEGVGWGSASPGGVGGSVGTVAGEGVVGSVVGGGVVASMDVNVSYFIHAKGSDTVLTRIFTCSILNEIMIICFYGAQSITSIYLTRGPRLFK